MVLNKAVHNEQRDTIDQTGKLLREHGYYLLPYLYLIPIGTKRRMIRGFSMSQLNKFKLSHFWHLQFGRVQIIHLLLHCQFSWQSRATVSIKRTGATAVLFILFLRPGPCPNLQT